MVFPNGNFLLAQHIGKGKKTSHRPLTPPPSIDHKNYCIKQFRRRFDWEVGVRRRRRRRRKQIKKTMSDLALFCRHLVEVSNTRLGGATWCKDCGVILDRTRRGFSQEMLGSSLAVERPPVRPKKDQVPQGGKIYLGVVRSAWVMQLRMAKERYREKYWPNFVEQMESEGGIFI